MNYLVITIFIISSYSNENSNTTCSNLTSNDLSSLNITLSNINEGIMFLSDI